MLNLKIGSAFRWAGRGTSNTNVDSARNEARRQLQDANTRGCWDWTT